MTTISKSLLNGLPIKIEGTSFEILNQNPQGLSAVSIYAQIKMNIKLRQVPFIEFYLSLKTVKSSKGCFRKSKSIYKLRKDKMSCNLISLKTSEALNFENEKVKELLHEVTDIIFANTGVDISSVELNLYTE